MAGKPVIASMSNEMVLSIEDLERGGSKKLPAFKRGQSSVLIFCSLSLSILIRNFLCPKADSWPIQSSSTLVQPLK